jgi:hypothetical protein
MEKSNIGVIAALGVLFVLLILNYNRCYVNINENFDVPLVDVEPQNIDVQDISSPPVNTPKYPAPKNVRVNVTPVSCTLNFNVDISNNNPIPEKFIVILAQYDKNKKYLGSNKFYLSDEYSIGNRQAVNPELHQNLCSIVNGLPTCSYSFNNLVGTDINGDAYLYKIGVSAIYKDGNSDFTLPSNIINNFFILDTNIDAQTQEYQEFIKYKSVNQSTESDSMSSNMLSTADGQYEMIKNQLGNYPDNLEISNEEIRSNTLSDLIDKSMSLGKIIVKVNPKN